jgi:phosphoribosylformylglycinamidine synthase
LAEACREFNTPVVGGNVSLYNQSPVGAVDPTPTVGMVGLIDQPGHITTQAFKGPGDAILLLGEPGSELGGSHYVKVIHGRKAGRPPRLDYAKEKGVQGAVRALIRMGLVRSAHDCSEGGLAVALAECCINGEETVGAEIDLSAFWTGRADELLFNESQSRIVISVRRENAAAALALAEWQGVPARRLGFTGGEYLRIKAGEREWPWLVKELRESWWGAIRGLMEEG